MRSSYYLFSVSERLKNFVYEIREYIFEIYNIDHEKDIEEKKGRVLEQDIDNIPNTNKGQTDRQYENNILQTRLVVSLWSSNTYKLVIYSSALKYYDYSTSSCSIHWRKESAYISSDVSQE